MLYDSPVTGARRPRRRRLPVVLAFALVCAGLLAFGAVQSFGDHAPPACASNNQQGALCVSVIDTPDPVAYSDVAGTPTFVSYHSELRNTGNSNLSHVALRETLPTQIAVDATGGQYRITFNGQTTGDIAFNAPASSVQSALEGLSNIEPGDITVAGGPGDEGGTHPYVLTVTDQYPGTDVPVVTTQPGSVPLSGGGAAATVSPWGSFVSATPSQACSTSSQSVTCTIGTLRSGGMASVDVVVKVPPAGAENPPDATLTDRVAGSFDETFNDQQNGGKQDTVIYSEPTKVSKTAGSTFIPKDQGGAVTTGGGTQQGTTTITGNPNDLVAFINLQSPDSFCVNGQFTPPNSKKSYVCRDGAFVHASVLNAADNTHYTNANSPLVFHLRWDASLVSSKQTVSNFVVFYQGDGSNDPITVISARCNSKKPPAPLPCLQNISKNKVDGSWSVELVRADNGHMR